MHSTHKHNQPDKENVGTEDSLNDDTCKQADEAGYILNDLSTRNQETVIHWYKEYRCRSSLFKY